MKSKHLNHVGVLLGSAILVAVASPAELSAQARSSVRFQTVGRLGKIGDSAAGRNFQSHSYGLGSLQSPSGGVGGSVLRSNISSPNFSLRRSLGRSSPNAIGTGIAPARASGRRISAAGGGLAAPGRLIAPASRGGRIYKPLAASGGVPLTSGKLRLARDASTFAAAQAYMDLIAKPPSESLAESTTPITSLVPEGESTYRTHLSAGEEAFRAGDFTEALDQFKLAGYIAPRAPETLLSKSHARFALSRLSYALAAFQLRLALRYLPELPLLPLRPKAFYGNAATYATHLRRLNDHLNKEPHDADGHLLMAYFLWFDDQADQAAEALAKAKATAAESKDKDVREAVEIFRAGMVASGKVRGDLGPTTQPAASPVSAGPGAAGN